MNIQKVVPPARERGEVWGMPADTPSRHILAEEKHGGNERMDNRRKTERVEPTQSTAIEERPVPIHGRAGMNFWKNGRK